MKVIKNLIQEKWLKNDRPGYGISKKNIVKIPVLADSETVYHFKKFVM